MKTFEVGVKDMKCCRYREISGDNARNPPISEGGRMGFCGNRLTRVAKAAYAKTHQKPVLAPSCPPPTWTPTPNN